MQRHSMLPRPSGKLAVVLQVFALGNERRLTHLSFVLVLAGYAIAYLGDGGRGLRPSLLPLVFVAFNLLLYAGIYLWNDIVDLPLDRLHPTKCKRLVASGKLSVAVARVLATALVASGLAVGFVLSPSFGVLEAVVLGVNVLYTLRGKHVRFLDVAGNAATYPLRALIGTTLGGGAAVDYLPSVLTVAIVAWTTTALRRHFELVHVGSISRPVLKRYTTRQLAWAALLPGLAWPVLIAVSSSQLERVLVSLGMAVWMAVTLVWASEGAVAHRRPSRARTALKSIAQYVLGR